MSKSLTEQFKDWVATKPADEAYEYCGSAPCACRQFLTDRGIPTEWVSGSPRATLENRFYVELQNCGTFGALAQRLASIPHGDRDAE